MSGITGAGGCLTACEEALLGLAQVSDRGCDGGEPFARLRAVRAAQHGHEEAHRAGLLSQQLTWEHGRGTSAACAPGSLPLDARGECVDMPWKVGLFDAAVAITAAAPMRRGRTSDRSRTTGASPPMVVRSAQWL